MDISDPSLYVISHLEGQEFGFLLQRKVHIFYRQFRMGIQPIQVQHPGYFFTGYILYLMF